MRKLVLVASAVLLAVPAMAQHVHQKGPNGGPLEDVAGVHLEMVASGKTLTFNVFDEANKPVSTGGLFGLDPIGFGGRSRDHPARSVGDSTQGGREE